MIYDLKRSVNLRWLFDPVLHLSLDDLVVIIPNSFRRPRHTFKGKELAPWKNISLARSVERTSTAPSCWKITSEFTKKSTSATSAAWPCLHHQHWRLTSNMLIWKKGWNPVPCVSTKERPSQIFGVTWRLTTRIDPKWFVDTAVDLQKCQKKQWRITMWRHMDKREKSLVATCAITYFHREHMWPSIFRKFTEMSKLASQESNSGKESKVYSIWPNKIIAV